MVNSLNNEIKTQQNTSLVRSAFIGAVAGFAEIFFNHPLWMLKTRSQCRYPFTVHPFILYKGLTYHAAGELILSAIQIGGGIKLSEELNHRFKNYPCLQAESTTIPLGTLLGSLTSGALTGVMSTPIDVVMVQQQKNAKIESVRMTNDFLSIANQVRYQHGHRILFCGSPVAAIKIGLFNSGVFVGAPYFGKELNCYIGCSVMLGYKIV